MNEQVRIEEKTHFYTDKKDTVDWYAKYKKMRGYRVRVETAQPKGWVVISTIWLDISE